MDWFSRRVLCGRVSMALEADCWIKAAKSHQLNLSRFWCAGKARLACISVIACHHLPVIDAKVAWQDNAVVERLWRIIKFKEVYLRGFASLSTIPASTTPGGPIHRLTGRPRIRPTSNSRCRMRQQSNRGENHLENALNLFCLTEPVLTSPKSLRRS
ncbi:hypothetical protein [Sagittula marina]|uniref:hypothetical protein n=1 Tax=Sagittula marina TaxID=943940 RepID=UPI0031D225AE